MNLFGAYIMWSFKGWIKLAFRDIALTESHLL